MHKNNQIKSRKKQHLKIAASDSSQYKKLTTGFENYRFIHCALPEMDFNKVNITTQFLDYDIACPLVINPISGGENNGKRLNRALAKVAAAEKIALSLGSIRAALEDRKSLQSFKVVNDYSGEIPLIVNIGCLQTKSPNNRRAILKVCDALDADAISVHLNPLQEIIQPEGGKDFRGVLRAIGNLQKVSERPIIIKEVGFGLSRSVVKKLIDTGIKWFDVSGGGGTSWSRIEAQRVKNPEGREVAKEFFEWGIPTAKCLRDIEELDDIKIIASGGIRSGQDFAKSLALGANLAGIAGSVVQVWSQFGQQEVEKLIKKYK